jgi:hypothetical protein
VGRKRVVRSPDGRVWTISVSRFRAPKLRQSDYEPHQDADWFLDWVLVILEYAYAIVVWYVVPVLVALVELPIVFVRSLFSSRRWIEAKSNDLHPIVAVWTADRRDASLVADELADSLETGYQWPSPAGSEFVEMSEPPALEDLHD